MNIPSDVITCGSQGLASSASQAHLVIVGGGFSGTMLAVQLMRQLKKPLRLTIVDRFSSPGRGVAYSSTLQEHLLNVPAARMSAFAAEPLHFLNWLQKCGYIAEPQEFAPRFLYGTYVGELFAETCQANPQVEVTWARAEVSSVRVREQRAQIVLSDGSSLEANVAVFATGNASPALPFSMAHIGDSLLSPYDWGPGAPSSVPSDSTVLILGTGLTAVDQVIALQALNFEGTIYMLSRRGKLPATHARAPSKCWPALWIQELPPELYVITGEIRRQIKSARQLGIDWRCVIDAIRPYTSHLWQRLSVDDRRRFLRHLQPYWETARHRMPHQACDLIEAYRNRRKLTVLAGSVLSVTPSRKMITVCYRKRGTDECSRLSVDRIINCVGPGSTPLSGGTVIDELLRSGLARQDALGLGIDTDNDGAVIASTGAQSSCLYTLGPVRKATLWETTAVAEIREQAAVLARTLLNRLFGPDQVPTAPEPPK